jgi:hypothetical protein
MPRTDRVIRRIQEVKGMKNRIRNLRIGMRIAFQAGRESIAVAAHKLSYGEGYAVTGQDLVDGNGTVPTGDSPVPVVSEELAAPKVPFIVPA